LGKEKERKRGKYSVFLNRPVECYFYRYATGLRRIVGFKRYYLLFAFISVYPVNKDISAGAYEITDDHVLFGVSSCFHSVIPDQGRRDGCSGKINRIVDSV